MPMVIAIVPSFGVIVAVAEDPAGSVDTEIEGFCRALRAASAALFAVAAAEALAAASDAFSVAV